MDNLIAQDADLIDVSSGVTEADREVLIRISNSDDETAQRIRRGLIYTWEVGEIARHRQQATEAQAAEIERLREALGWFLNDSRFVVQVGGNPNVVPQMIEAARAALEARGLEIVEKVQ